MSSNKINQDVNQSRLKYFWVCEFDTRPICHSRGASELMKLQLMENYCYHLHTLML